MKRPATIDRANRTVQDYVEFLEARIKRMEGRLEEALGVSTPETPVFLHNYNIDKDRPLPEFGIIRYRTGPDIDQYVDVQKNVEKSGGILIRAGRALVIEPRASNTAIIHWSKML